MALPASEFVQDHAVLVGAIVALHIVLIAALVCCLAVQDTDPAWLKAQKKKKGS